MQKVRPHLRYANVTATAALFIALGGTTYAATGGNFVLGQPNSASATTALSSDTTGATFRATNTSTGVAGSFNVAASQRPFTVSSGVKVTNLNADKLDGLDSTSLISTSTLRRFNFLATTLGGFPHSCFVGQIGGLNLQNNHLVLTPENESTDDGLQYSVEYSSASGDAWLKACNPTDSQIGGTRGITTRFNLLAIAP